MDTTAVVLDAPERLTLRRLGLRAVGASDVVVEIDFSGISTGTERLLYSGTMPAFPGMGYPLVPGYESVGRVVAAGAEAQDRIGDSVFVPGANCYTDARGLFGGAARRVILPTAKALTIDPSFGAKGALLALAATAYHALAGGRPADLIVGHGVLGRLLARLTVALGGVPIVWETNAVRATGATDYPVTDATADNRRDYASIYDVSGAPGMLDLLIARLAHGGDIVLAGFYDRLDFSFPPAFMREARLRIAAEFKPVDLAAVTRLIADGRLSLDGLITHSLPASAANDAYVTAFGDAACLKMVLDWSDCA